MNGSTNKGLPGPAAAAAGNVAAAFAQSFALLLGKLRGGCRTTDGADMVVVVEPPRC